MRTEDQIDRWCGHVTFLVKVTSHIYTFLCEGPYAVDQNLDFLYFRPVYVLFLFSFYFFIWQNDKMIDIWGTLSHTPPRKLDSLWWTKQRQYFVYNLTSKVCLRSLRKSVTNIVSSCSAQTPPFNPPYPPTSPQIEGPNSRVWVYH